MKKRSKFDFDTECNFSDLPRAEREAACKYEYMRESQLLRDKLKVPRSAESLKGQKEGVQEKRVNAADKFLRGETVPWGGQFWLRVALLKSGFPKPWKCLTKQAQKEFVTVIGRSAESRKNAYPPVLIKAGAPELVSPGVPGRSSNVWRLMLSEHEFHWPPQSETDTCFFGSQAKREYFYGFIRIDEAYNQTELRAAFTTWLKGRYDKTKSGGGGWPQWQGKLNDLVVMRVWNAFPGKKNVIKRVEHVANLTTTGFKGCKKYWKEYCKAKKSGHYVDHRMSESKAANEEMSRARTEALKFFQRLFSGEKPLSWRQPESS
jgi:hypothetical protein